MSGVILAVVEDPDVAAHTLAGAQQLAALVGSARINVLVIRTPPAATILVSEEILIREREVLVRSRESQRAAALWTVFANWSQAAEAAGITADWFDIEGPADELVREWGQRADFVVLKRPGSRNLETHRQAIHAALFDTDRPVLIVPPEPPPTVFGRCVGILWRDDRRTIKAVLAALRCLRRTERVHVLAGARQGESAPAMPDVLAEHGVQAELHPLPIGSDPFGEVLLRTAHSLEIDLLVMGAFVHNPIRTLILGGVTRYMLSHADLPILMRH